jgi:predicted acyltransferase
MGLLVAISIGDQEGVFDSAGLGGGWINPGDLLGTHPAIVTAGMLVGGLFGRDSSARDPRRRIGFMAWFGTALCLAGFLLRPLHGFHKIGGTESWGLVTAGLCCLAFMLFYAVMDFWGKNSMLRPLEPIGKNPLLAYLLPDILGLVMGFTGTWYWFWPFWNQGGGVGLANAAVVTAGVLGLTWVLTRLGFVVRL